MASARRGWTIWPASEQTLIASLSLVLVEGRPRNSSWTIPAPPAHPAEPPCQQANPAEESAGVAIGGHLAAASQKEKRGEMSNPLRAVIMAHGLERWSQLDAVRVRLVQGGVRPTLPGQQGVLARDLNGASPWAS
jgi:hypothetical protein